MYVLPFFFENGVLVGVFVFGAAVGIVDKGDEVLEESFLASETFFLLSDFGKDADSGDLVDELDQLFLGEIFARQCPVAKHTKDSRDMVL